MRSCTAPPRSNDNPCRFVAANCGNTTPDSYYLRITRWLPDLLPLRDAQRRLVVLQCNRSRTPYRCILRASFQASIWAHIRYSIGFAGHRSPPLSGNSRVLQSPAFIIIIKIKIINFECVEWRPPAARLQLGFEIMSRQRQQCCSVLCWQLIPISQQCLWRNTSGVQSAHLAAPFGIEAASANITCSRSSDNTRLQLQRYADEHSLLKTM